MNKKSTIILLIIIIIIILSFFIILNSIEVSAINDLQVKIKNVQIQDIKINHTTLKVNVEISNPTNLYISKLDINYSIFIASSFIGKGNMTFTEISAGMLKESSTLVTISYLNAASAAVDAIINQNFNLTINGTFYTKALFDIFPISRDFTSTFSYT